MKLALAGIGLLATGLLVTFLLSAPTVADNKGSERRHKDSDVTWTPSALNFSMKPGETVSLPVTYTAREKIDEDTIVYASTSLKDIVSVTPTKIGPLRKGQTGTITVVVKLPILQGPGTTTGFIQLYDTDRRNDRRPERAGMPLAIQVNVVWASVADETSGISFSYPEFGHHATFTTSTADFGGAGTATIYDFQIDTGTAGAATSQFLVTVMKNPSRLSLAAWIRQYVDPEQILVSSGSLRFRQLSNGLQSFVLAGPIPDSYDAGPISNLFAMSQSGETVIAIVSSHDQLLSSDLGIDRTKLQASFEAMLDNMVLP
jgi:hypothetical protein